MPPREKKVKLEEFDPYPPHERQTMSIRMRLEGVEGEEGHHFMRWIFRPSTPLL